MAYKVDVQVKDTTIIALIINDRGEELFRGEFECHLENRGKMIEQVTKITEANLLQMEKRERQTKAEKSNGILV